MSDDKNPERGLITSLIENENVEEFYQDINADWFFHVETRRAWAILDQHWHDHRETISRELLLEYLPGFTFEHWTSSTPAIIEVVRNNWITNRMVAIHEEAAEEALDDPSDALSEAIAALTQLQARVDKTSSSIDIASTAQNSRDRYEIRKANDGQVGLPWPWAPMQDATLGAPDGSYNVIYARPKNAKTFLGLIICAHWHEHFDRRVLICSREMPAEQLQDRIICIRARVDYKKFRLGQLSKSEERAFFDACDDIEEQGNIWVENIDAYGAAAANQIFTLGEKHGLRPGDVVLADGMYFFAKDSDWSSMRSFSQGFKQGLLRTKYVGIGTTQGNQNTKFDIDSDAGREVGLGDAPIMDCDMSMKVKLDKADKHILCMVNNTREGDVTMFTIHAKFCHDFTLKASDNPEEPKAAPTQKGRLVGRKETKPKPLTIVKGGKKAKRPIGGKGKKPAAVIGGKKQKRRVIGRK